MIAYLIGTVTDVSDDNIVVENNRIGFNVKVPDGYAYKPGEEVRVFTYTYVKEDAFLLYGFRDRDSLELFKKLITVSGIGPKGALSILSAISADELRFAIYSQDASVIAKAPGIGKKTAERVILDLKDKVTLSEMTSLPGQAYEVRRSAAEGFEAARRDAAEALTALGYGAAEAAKAVSKVPVSDDTTAEEILKGALQYLF